MFLPGGVKNIIIFPLDFLYRCAILSQTIVWHAVHQTGVVFSLQGHSSTVEYRSPKPRMRVRFLLPLPIFSNRNRDCDLKRFGLGVRMDSNPNEIMVLGSHSSKVLQAFAQRNRYEW